jgi:hypothetical protein
VSITIPDERDAALRDLTRSREGAVRARLKARQQLKALLLLRHRHCYTVKTSWTAAHEMYLAAVSSSSPHRISPSLNTASPCVTLTSVLSA